jgi:hypothetical protein
LNGSAGSVGDMGELGGMPAPLELRLEVVGENVVVWWGAGAGVL